MRSKLMVALLASEAIHLLLFGLLAEVTIEPGREFAFDGIMTWIHDDPPERNLVNDDISNDPDLPTNYNIDRIEDVDVPGPVLPEEAPLPEPVSRPWTR